MTAAAPLDETHDPARRSWVASANHEDTDFPIQNLPLGSYTAPGGGRRCGIAIGACILDLAAAHAAGLFAGEAAAAAQAGCGPTLNALLALGNRPARALRRAVATILDAGSQRRPELLHTAADCTLHLPCDVGNYTDFFAGIHHASAASRIMRPSNPELPANYKWVPIAYHGRASSLVVSGTTVRRPHGQRRPDPSAAPSFGPTQRLDLELEMAVLVGPGNALGAPVPIADASAQVFGLCLLNDWSARDIQAWEAMPLGPFLGKNFCTTLSPWIVTADALAPFRASAMTREAGDPRPLDYLWSDDDQAAGGLDVELTVWMRSRRMRDQGTPAAPIIRSNARYLYWTIAQMVAHHTSGGCNLQPGDVLGTGTISGPTDAMLSSLLELTLAGQRPFELPTGERRAFLEDGDEISFSARCAREGYVPIGFGACAGTVLG